MDEFLQYKRTSIAEMRPVRGTDTLFGLTSAGVSISDADMQEGSPREGDMIARNPANHDDKWLVAKQYFEDNFEEIERYSDE